MKFLIVGLLALALAAPAAANPEIANSRPVLEGVARYEKPSNEPPRPVARAERAADRIARRPYVYGGGHSGFQSAGYDCSGSVSYVLHAAGVLSAPLASGGLAGFGLPGRGRYITIYANGGHAWMTIRGRRFDTIALKQTGSRWSRVAASAAGYTVRHPAGL